VRGARILAENFPSLETLASASLEDLERIPEIGPKTAQSILFFFQEEKNRQLLEKLKNYGVQMGKVEKRKKGPLAEKKFVFTGSLERYSRDKARELVESLGARAVSSVSKKVDYVVAGKNPGSKYEKAKELEVRILNEEEFQELLDKAGR